MLPAAMTRWVMEQVTLALDSGQVQVVEYELAAVEVEDRRLGRAAGMQHFEGKIAPLPSRYDGKRAVAWVTRNITRQYELQQRPAAERNRPADRPLQPPLFLRALPAAAGGEAPRPGDAGHRPLQADQRSLRPSAG